MLVERRFAQVFFITEAALESRFIIRIVDHHVAVELKAGLKHLITAWHVAAVDFFRVVNERMAPQVTVPDEL